MISTVFQRIPLLAKAILFIFLILGLISSGAYVVFMRLAEYLLAEYNVVLQPQTVIDILHINSIIGATGIMVFVIGIFIMDVNIFLNRVRELLADSLADRQLQESLSHLIEKKSFESTIREMSALLSLYRSFDQMKSGRIALEMNTIKLLFGHIKEGFLLVNKEKVVTHINHKGEQMLKLIPGEIIGQALSRKVSNENMNHILEEAFEFDKKFVQYEIDLKDELMEITVLPIKDKFGEIVRAIIILNKPELSEKQLSEDPH
jgi:transcriptional regulator with PAS, ATPase and Fis domain